MDAVIGLGANLGDRRGTLARAVAALGERTTLVAVSSLYETAPIGPPQPDYLNAAARLQTDLDPASLLALMMDIERRSGRERRERWQARTLDLDLLWIRGRSLDTPELQVPHPRLTERAFALLPLVEVAPDAADPTTQTQYARLAPELDASGVRIVAPPDWWGSA